MAKEDLALQRGGEFERPVRLIELLAETARLYGERFWTALGIGFFVALALLLGFATGHPVGFVAIAAVAFTIAWAVSARVASGDRFRQSWKEALRRMPVLLPLVFIVAVPFALGRIDPLLMIIAILWVTVTGFSIPVTVLEHDPSRRRSWSTDLQFALGRSVALARAGFVHALGTVAVYVLLYILVGGVLVQALLGFASNGALASTLLAQFALSPFFFFGLSLLYYDQRTRSRASAPLNRGRDR